jgi:hypothetical protein
VVARRINKPCPAASAPLSARISQSDEPLPAGPRLLLLCGAPTISLGVAQSPASYMQNTLSTTGKGGWTTPTFTRNLLTFVCLLSSLEMQLPCQLPRRNMASTHAASRRSSPLLSDSRSRCRWAGRAPAVAMTRPLTGKPVMCIFTCSVKIDVNINNLYFFSCL